MAFDVQSSSVNDPVSVPLKLARETDDVSDIASRLRNANLARLPNGDVSFEKETYVHPRPSRVLLRSTSDPPTCEMGF